MKCKSLLLIAVIITAFATPHLRSQGIYYGIGGQFFIPQTNFDKTNKECFGVKLEIIAKNYCKLWYGFRVDYLMLKEKDELQLNHYDKGIYLSPEIKWAPFVQNCFDYKFIPYLQGMITFSSISGTDQLSKFGIGGGLGLGFAYNFKCFDRCWMIDLDGLYSAPNSFYRDDKRNTLQSINVGLTLSVAL